MSAGGGTAEIASAAIQSLALERYRVCMSTGGTTGYIESNTWIAGGDRIIFVTATDCLQHKGECDSALPDPHEKLASFHAVPLFRVLRSPFKNPV